MNTFEDSTLGVKKKNQLPAEDVDSDSATILQQAEDVEQQGFPSSVPPNEEAVREATDVIARVRELDALPEVTELPMEEFHAGLELAGPGLGNKDQIFADAKRRVEGVSGESIDVRQEKRADSILQAAHLLEQAEKRLQDAEQRWAQAETDRMGVESRIDEGSTTQAVSSAELQQVTERTKQLKQELDRQRGVVEKMRSVYKSINQPIQPGKI